MIILLFARVFKTKDFSFFKYPVVIFFLMMVLAETLSSIMGVNPQKSFQLWSSFWVVMFLFVSYTMTKSAERDKYLNWLYVGTLFSVGYSIYTVYVSKTVERAEGFFSHSLTYGNSMAMVAILLAGVLVFKLYDKSWKKYVYGLVLIAAIYILILSGSRGPILSFLIAFTAMLIYHFRLKGVVFASLILLVLVVIVIKTPSVNKRFAHTLQNLEQTTSSVGTRLVLWEASSKAIMAKPLFGYGKGNFKVVVNKYINVPTASRAHAHNSYIQYTFLHGIFGLFAMLGFLGSLMLEIVRKMRTSDYAKVALFVFFVYLLEGLTENNFTDSEVAMMAYFIIGVLTANGRQGRQPSVSTQPN